MRGEKAPGHRSVVLETGSPPHARGKAQDSAGLAVHIRITPACAGKSCTAGCRQVRTKDHPRMRGEKALSWYRAAAFLGSPPHARGKDHRELKSIVLAGITPACAGKSHKFRQKCGGDEDHPRMRGEKSTCCTACWTASGSPPHARGKAPGHAEVIVQPGITPACAGKSRQGKQQRAGGRDHPRMRGEKHHILKDQAS